MANTTVLAVIAGLAAGVALIVSLSAFFSSTNIGTNSINLPEPDGGVVSFAAKVVGKKDSPKYSAEYLGKLSAGSIVIDDRIVNRSPKLGELLASAETAYEVGSPLDKLGGTFYTTLTTTDLDSIIMILPHQERIIVKSEPRLSSLSNTNTTANTIVIPLLYHDTYYHLGAAYFSSVPYELRTRDQRQ